MKKTTPTSETPVSNTEKPAPAKATKKTASKSVPAKAKQETSASSGKTKAKPKATKTVAEAPITVESIEKAPEMPVAKATPKKADPKPKAAKVEPTVESAPVAAAPVVISMHERIGLTAGVIWHHLAEHGATPVAKLVYVLPEEEAIIQRSIGWLAQEDKITLSARGGDQVETIVLKG